MISKSGVPRKIVTFILEHHVMTLATLGEGGLHCCNLFYAYQKDSGSFIFTSSTSTEHGANMASNPKVAASIVLETNVVGKIRGLQIKGSVKQLKGKEESVAKATYLKKYPFAVLAPLELWELKIEWAKQTDNRLGFGNKLIWSIEDEEK